jgi:uncharacterized protein involved in exopolysaccharide biosynthesis
VLLGARTYTSQATVITQSRRPQSVASGLAAQFGINLSTTESSLGPQFYIDLMTSRTILEAVATTTYTIQDEGKPRTGTLIQLYDIKGSPSRALVLAARKLSSSVNASVSQRTGVITLEATTRWPELSTAIATRVIALVEQFNIASRQSQAAAERKFTEARAASGLAELRAAEDEYRRFLEANRDYGKSSALNFRGQQLAYEVSLKQQLYTSLAQAFEQARIEEVRDTPLLTRIDPPSVPALPDSRRLVTKTILGGLAFVFLAIAIVVVRWYAGPNSSSDRAARELRAELGEAWGDIRRPWRVFQRALTSSSRA